MNAYTGDTHHHWTKEIAVEEQLEMLRSRGDDFVFLEFKDMEPVSIIPDPKTLTTPEFLVIPGSEQAFVGSEGTWNHLSIEPNRLPIPDTETDNWHVPDGFDHLNRRFPNALLRINHPADGRWTVEDVREAVARKARIWELNPARNPVQYAIDMWDECLSEGMLLYAALSTDIHSLRAIDVTGYVTIWAPELSQKALLEAMRGGEFVAVERGCPVEPAEVVRGDGKAGSAYQVAVPSPATVRFIGNGGEVLSEVEGAKVSYEIKGGEKYIRAEVLADGKRAFTQPVLVSNG